jgi:hypothetical protein
MPQTFFSNDKETLKRPLISWTNPTLSCNKVKSSLRSCRTHCSRLTIPQGVCLVGGDCVEGDWPAGYKAPHPRCWLVSFPRERAALFFRKCLLFPTHLENDDGSHFNKSLSHNWPTYGLYSAMHSKGIKRFTHRHSLSTNLVFLNFSWTCRTFRLLFCVDS